MFDSTVSIVTHFIQCIARVALSTHREEYKGKAAMSKAMQERGLAKYQKSGAGKTAIENSQSLCT